VAALFTIGNPFNGDTFLNIKWSRFAEDAVDFPNGLTAVCGY